MGDKQRSDSRWTYFQARLTEIAGDKAGAQALYREAARKPEFHGFLAADRIGQPYALCPVDVTLGTPQQAAIARDPAIVRAMALYQADRPGWAQREWDEALSRFDDTQRRLAVAVAQDHGWFDRAVFALGKQPEEHAHVRPALPACTTTRRSAAKPTKNGLDPAWVAAEIRAESVFNPNARSGANAMGLMQVVPGDGHGGRASASACRGTACRRSTTPTRTSPSAPPTCASSTTGTARPTWCSPATTRGPRRSRAGSRSGPGMDPDFWIETISYKETREYVARVLAFSVIYDWRLNGDAAPVTDRMRGRAGTRKAFACPTAVAAKLALESRRWRPILVGGAVRDRLLGLPAGDRDYVVVGGTPEAMLAQGFKPVGRDFPVFLHPKTGEEYALARTERKSGRGYRGFVVDADPA